MSLVRAIAALVLLGAVATVRAAPQADIKANDSDVAIGVPKGAPVSLKISFTPETLGNTALERRVYLLQIAFQVFALDRIAQRARDEGPA